MLRVARVYTAPGPDDGARVLVDGLWPRGLRKETAHIDQWCKEVAPSAELRKWYSHRPDRFAEFERRYQAELADPERSAAVADLRRRAKSGTVTLLTATSDVALSHATVLAAAMKRRTK